MCTVNMKLSTNKDEITKTHISLICLFIINIIKRKFHQNVSDGLNGIVDSLRTLFMGDRHKNLPLIKLLLKAF